MILCPNRINEMFLSSGVGLFLLAITSLFYVAVQMQIVLYSIIGGVLTITTVLSTSIKHNTNFIVFIMHISILQCQKSQ